MKGLLGVLASAICVGTYFGNHPETVSTISSTSQRIYSVVIDVSSEAVDIAGRVYDILGDPKTNWERGIDGFVAAGQQTGKIQGVSSSVDYSKIYDVMDVDKLRGYLQTSGCQQ